MKRKPIITFWFSKLITFLKLAQVSTVLLSLLAFLFATAHSLKAPTCNLCCPSLFSSPEQGIEGVVNIRGRPILMHTISYAVRCLFSNEDVVLISDEIIGDEQSINMQRNRNSFRRSCSYPENSPISLLSTQAYLSHFPGTFFRNAMFPFTTSPYRPYPQKRANFVFATKSETQLMSLIQKVEQDLKELQSVKRLGWNPVIIFMWSDIQLTFRSTQQNIQPRPGLPLIKSWFRETKPSFSLESGIFFFFIVQKGNSTRSQTNLFLSLWESYSLKGKFFVKEVLPPLNNFNTKQVESENDKCIANSAIMEKLNSYVFLERFKRRSDFEKTLITGSLSDPQKYTDWVELKVDANGTGFKLQRGFSADIYKDLQTMMNFSEAIIVLLDENGTSSTYNQTYTMLSSELADISLNMQTIFPERTRLFSIMQPTNFGILQVFFVQPSANSIRDIVSAPFALPLWVTLVATWVLLVLCVRLCGWKYNGKRVLDSYSYSKDARFIQEFGLWTVAATCQKSWYLSPTSFVFTLIFSIGWLMALVCYVAYSATIVSFLTVKTVPVQTINDLIGYEYRFTVHEDSQGTIIVLEEIIGTFNLTQEVITTDSENEITHLIETKNAFLSYPDLFYKTAIEQNFTEKFICTSLYSLPMPMVPYKSSMFLKKGSQFRELFGEKLIIIMERGLNYRYKKVYDTKNTKPCIYNAYDDSKIVVDPVHLTDVFTAFLIILIGWVIATWVFFSERLYHKRRMFYLIFII